MENFLGPLSNIDYSSFPIIKVALVVGIFILTLLLRQLIFTVVVKRIERLASQSETQLDDGLLKVLKPIITTVLCLVVIRAIPAIFAGELTPQANEAIVGIIKLLTLVGVVFIIYRASSVLGFFVTNIVIKALKRFNRGEIAQTDSDLIRVLKPSIRLLVFLIGLWMVQLFWGSELSDELSDTFNNGFSLLTVVVITTVIYRSASLLGEITTNLLLTTTEEAGLSDLLRPFLPKLFQSIAIIVLIIKGAEIFFGGDTGPLVGLLGGAGLTLGLLFKDLIYDWFCTVIIYTDKLYKEGDWIVVTGLDAMVQVVEIGFRSTTLLSSTRASIQKIPNSKMISGILQNWSQDAGEEEVWGIPITLKIDSISSQKAARVCEGLKEVHQSLDGVKEKVLIRFKGLEQNSRVFEFRLYTVLSSFFRIEREAHVAILAMLEKEGINTLYVELRTEPESYQKQLKAVEN
ncbi:MAG: mechanosensitive ion channel family protein [Symploca sp. SIO2B6]|nr:mechanosensitive ion channel family protein [Symploca sp. SIO2B6]